MTIIVDKLPRKKNKAAKPVQPTMKPFALLEGTTAINAAITSIAKRGKMLERDIHILAVSCMAHCDKHGDITLAQKLVTGVIEALPKFAKSHAMIDWFITFGKFKYDDKLKTVVFDKTKTTDLEGAIAKPFWEFRADKAYVPFDYKKAVLQLVARAERAKKNGDDVPLTVIDNLKQLAV